MGTNLLGKTRAELERIAKGKNNLRMRIIFEKTRCVHTQEKVRTAWSWPTYSMSLSLSLLISALPWMEAVTLSSYTQLHRVRRTGGWPKNKRQFTASRSVECRLEGRIHSLTNGEREREREREREGGRKREGAKLCQINYRRKKDP